MQDKIEALKAEMAPALDLKGAANVLEWDQETYMPLGGAQARADQYATLKELQHRHATSPRIGQLLDELTPYLDDLDPASDEAGLIRIARREYEKRVKVPAGLISQIASTGSRGMQAWIKARADNDFALFQPYLEQMVDLKIQWAECFAPYENIYDPLLDEYEPGMTYEQIAAVFSGLKPRLVELVRAISAHQDAVDDSVLRGTYTQDEQLAFSREVVEALGYDFSRGRLDLSAHPFTIDIALDDVRITTRIFPELLTSGLMSSVHEAGHAIYEQNVSPAYYRTVLANGASMSIHESQSRFYENILGRSRAFWRHFYPRLQDGFPSFRAVDLEAFYRAINRVQPSLIRVEADEVTYGLHVILRFELENDIVNGRVKVADLPAVWNARMEEYLGLVPPTDSEGVLQDIHWSMGYLGYFPDYLLGSVFSVQIWEQMQKELPAVHEQIEAGQFAGITGWLNEKIHRHGMKFTLPELSERLIGGPLRWEPYVNYLTAKFGDIYGL